MPPDLENETQGPKPWPGYFIVRTTGEVVPLIAVDELPPGTNLLGVPRALDLEATIGMLNLGLQQSSGSFYQIHGNRDKDGPTMRTPPLSSKLPEPRQPITSRLLTSNSTPSTAHLQHTRTSQPQPPHPAPESQICRHWCIHGICKWGQQCRFRHLMPMTLSGLRAVGLSDWPPWYRALNPGYFTNPGENRRTKGGRCVGDSCCAAATSNAVLVEKGVQRLRRPVPVDAGGRIEKERDMSGQQILMRLRSVQREDARRSGSGKKDHVRGNIILERAVAKDTKDWEDERGGEADLEVVEKGATKEKLVDV